MRALSLFVAGMLAITAANAADHTFTQQIAADPKGEVDITNVAGSIEVAGWDKAAVDVQGTVGSSVERVDVMTQGTHTVVKVVLPSFSGSGSWAKLRIRVPSGSAIELNSVSADFVGAGVSGAQRLKTVSGDVRAEIAAGDVDVKTVSGNVLLHGTGTNPGANSGASLRVQTVSGDVTIEHGAGSLEAATVSGGLVVQLDPAKSLRVRTTSGDLKFRGKLDAGAAVDAETISGDMTLEGGAQSGYQYDVSSFSGDIHSCFKPASEHSRKNGVGSAINGTLGAGNGRVRLKTMSGDVSLCDR